MAETSPFFELPAELRNEIYRYLLVDRHEVRAPTILNAASYIEFNPLVLKGLDLATKKVLKSFPADWPHDSRAAEDDEARAEAKKDWKAISQLLQVSRRMYDEASAILYGESIFNFRLYTSHLMDYRFLKFGPFREKSLRRMVNVRIEVVDDVNNEHAAMYEAEHTLRLLARHLTSLSKLQVRFDLHSWDEAGEHGILHAWHMREVLASFTVERTLTFRVFQVLSEPVFDHERYERWACRIAEEKDMMVYGVREMKRLRRCTVLCISAGGGSGRWMRNC